MKNILIINQHSQNHGDEAAGLALIRSLYQNGYRNITISYNIHCSEDRALLKYQKVKQLPPAYYLRGTARIVRIALKFPWFITRSVLLALPQFRADYKAIKDADFIINAPGGVNMGLYKDYIYLWRLLCAVRLNKSCAMYSSSIGPFDGSSKFTSLAQEVVRSVDFIALRDAQSCRYAKEMGRECVESIDTAFLESPVADIPHEIRVVLPAKYVVMVPNQLYLWQPKFKSVSREKMDSFYKGLIQYFVGKKINVVLLPQIFCNKTIDDEKYFNKLKSGIKNVTVISTEYSSDIQQQIIKDAEFVIGARYHTIIFAVNNKTPFYSLSYEHKMRNTLEFLGLQEYCVDLSDALESQDVAIEAIYKAYTEREQQNEKLVNGYDIAKKKAKVVYDKLLGVIGW